MKLRKWLGICAAISSLVMAPAALAFDTGDWVLGNFGGGGYWYPGVVESTKGRSVTIAYDDGDVETLPYSQVKPYDWRPGTRVQCNWMEAGTWYSGRIAAANGSELKINYDDGDRETTYSGNCRSR